MATLLENIQAKLDSALADDAALDAAAEEANTSRQVQIDALTALKAAVEAVPEALLVGAVQDHLAQVKASVIEAREFPGVTEASEPVIDAVIAQVAGDSDEVTEFSIDPAVTSFE